MNRYKKSLLYAHAAVFLFGFSALFARLINQPSVIITFGRTFFSSLFLFVVIKLNRRDTRLDSKKDYLLMLLSGVLLAVHWFCFIQSIKLSTVAIGTISYSTFPVFVSFLEPVFFKEKINKRVFICSLVILIGIIIILPVVENQNHESSGKAAGIAVGLVSGLTYAVLSLFNRVFSGKYKSEIIVFYEQATAAAVMLPFVFMIGVSITPGDFALLMVLGIVFTAFAHGLFVKSLRYLKAGTAGIIAGLEVVYSIIMALILLKEIPEPNEIIGGVIVIVIAAYITIIKKE